MTLKNMGIFSWTELDGLINIMRCLNRYDLVEKVELFIKEEGKAGRTKIMASSDKGERETFEQIYEKMVMCTMELEQQIRELRTVLRQPELVVYEGLEVVQKTEAVARSLITDLNRDPISLAGRISLTTPVGKGSSTTICPRSITLHTDRPIPKARRATFTTATSHMPKCEYL